MKFRTKNLTKESKKQYKENVSIKDTQWFTLFSNGRKAETCLTENETIT